MLRSLVLVISLSLFATTMPWRALWDAPAPVSLASSPVVIEEDVKEVQQSRSLFDALSDPFACAALDHACVGDQHLLPQADPGVPERPPKV
ncbi:MAG: hypothetical protein JNM31_13810 [Flavobacteriales bacterium]|nr:hypothetical protein [Flavobacteriales bacterium]